MISGNMVGMYSTIGQTFIFEDDDGNTVNGVIVRQETIFDATPADVRFGKTFANDEGVQVGTQYMPQYNYAIVDTNNMCVDVCGTIANHNGETGYVVISIYNPAYVGKYYNTSDSKWYIEASFNTEWTPV